MISSKLSKESERLIGDFIFIFYFCGVLAEADVKNPARGHKVVKHHPEGKNVRYTLHTRRKRQRYQKYTRKKRSKDDWTKARGFNESMKTKTKQNKTKVLTPEEDVMASANQTPGGYKFAPLVAGQQGRATQHESACFGLSSSWFFPSRSGIRLHAVVQPWLPLQRSISP